MCVNQDYTLQGISPAFSRGDRSFEPGFPGGIQHGCFRLPASGQACSPQPGAVPILCMLAQKITVTHAPRRGAPLQSYTVINSLDKLLGFFLQLLEGLLLDPVALEHFISCIQQCQDHKVQRRDRLCPQSDFIRFLIDVIRQSLNILPVSVTPYTIFTTEQSYFDGFGRFKQAAFTPGNLVGLVLFQVKASSFSIILSSLPLAAL